MKKQVAEVVALYEHPAAAIQALHDLFEFYADRTHRPGQAVPPAPLIPAYNAPPPVTRRVIRALEPLLTSDMPAALSLADALWAEEHLELRMLGILVLGRIPADPPEPVLERVEAWSRPPQEERLQTAVLTEGAARLRSEAQGAFLSLVKSWLGSSALATNKVGLLALPPLIASPGFLDLPLAFSLLSPLVRGAPAELRPYLLDNVAALAHRSPRETAYFLRQALTGAQDQTPDW